ncbi:hypothetical protein AYO44_11415 [Planctomycetaceae bacterium SCGC AG-212-F19]|nr:hypothetical protein AYO44_11415 [Planctomycetaceae bacterium SCGC AG-212-F19]
MPSPFPGMNPYLENDDAWHDFHERFCPACAEIISPQVRPKYIVKLDQHIYLHEKSADERLLLGRSDVQITQQVPAASPAGKAVSAAPVYARLPAVDVEKGSFIEVRDRESRALVTVIELLSPTNKRVGSDRDQYLAKRSELLGRGVHLVEIDLLRGGTRPPLEDLPDCDYYMMVSRAEERPRAGAWPIRLRDRLPVIPIPLQNPDPDAKVDLQPLLHHVYDLACYEDYIYRGKPQPPLHPEDAAWAESLIPK